MKRPFSSEQYEEQRLLHAKQSHLLAFQEKYWRQRFRALWLKDGDRNSAYFHRKASNRKNKNTIKGLLNAAGEWQSEPDTLQHMIFEYYAQVFCSEDVNDEAISTIFRATPMKVTSSMNDDLNLPYSDEEIKAALFQMHPSKSPGPEGFVLWPNRLKRWLPEIISPLQSAYVPGRLISDNTLVATEVAHFMHKLKSQEEAFFSLKLDISKAYDHLEWPFLQAILTKLGFASRWINMIMKCVTSVSYAILVNGEATATISPTRGIRQGDPLSPYLFILCAEGLSALISQVVQYGTIKGLKMCPQAPVLHHLFFADDSLLFGTATMSECTTVKFILSSYEKAPGQKVNFTKSIVVFSNNLQPQLKEDLAAVLNVKCVDEHDRYLGLPLRVGKSKTARFQYLKENVSKKLVNWKSKILSSAGKELLIKTVAQVMPTYAMNCYLLPKSLCDDIHKLCASFFWGDMEGKRKIHWRSWEKLCLTKIEGGLGFKNIFAYNLAMLAKQGWRLITKPSSLIAQVFKARYFPHCSFWDASLGDAPSYSWRSILESRSLLKAGTSWRIGDGTQINIWNDQWVPNCPRYLIQKPTGTVFETVADLIDPQSRTWIQASVQRLFTPTVAEKILCIPLGHQAVQDRLCWIPEKRGLFTVKSAYWIARQQVIGNVLASSSTGDPFQMLWKCLWKAKIPGKVQICVWRAVNNLLPIREQLLKKGYDGKLGCIVCNHKVESIAHLFCKCPTALQILSGSPFSLKQSLLPNLDFKEWMLEQALNLKSEIFEKLLMIIWGLWKNRNHKLWEGRVQSSHDIMLGCLAWLEEFQHARQVPASRVHNIVIKWEPAEIPKLNVDGAFLPHASHGGVGGVLRSSNGGFQSAFMRPVQHVNSAQQVELLAIKEGLNFIKTLHMRQVIIESDCLLAVQDIARTDVNLSDLSNLVQDIQSVANGMQGVQITFAPRSCNKVAHRLASLAFENGQRETWHGSVPSCILDLVTQDCNPLF